MPFSTTYSNQILNLAFAKTKTMTAPSQVYIGLCTNDPEADNGTFTELVGGGYERVLVSRSDDSYPGLIGTAADRSIKNILQINWQKATSEWDEVNGIGFFTTKTGGTPYYYGKLEEPVTCASGAVMLFDPETFKITFPSTDILEAAAAVSET